MLNIVDMNIIGTTSPNWFLIDKQDYKNAPLLLILLLYIRIFAEGKVATTDLKSREILYTNLVQHIIHILILNNRWNHIV